MPIFEYGIKHAIASNFPISDAAIAKEVKQRMSTKGLDGIIAGLLESDSPVALGRLGGTESRYVGNLIKLRTSYRKINPMHRWHSQKDFKKRQNEIRSLSGFFFADEREEDRFLQLYLNSLRNLDLIGVWAQAFTWAESISLENSNVRVVPLESISPWVESVPYSNFTPDVKPWISVLEGKKLLVVSPFANSIKSQHTRITACFEGVKYPSFALSVIKAPMTFDARADVKSNWFRNLDDLYNQVMDLDFDVALVGAGAYSLPLVSMIKDFGKKAIHTGGGTQLFFGIMGNRWNNSRYVQKYVNENWVRPNQNEIPISAQSIEDACYW